MKQAMHIGGIVLAAAILVITELTKTTHYAWAAGAVALLTNIETALGGPKVVS